MENTRRPGACACGDVRFELIGDPMIVHACHCRDCQDLSGEPFVVNAWIEADRLGLIAGRLKTATLSGGSGRRHEVASCERCGTAVWSRYEAAPGDTVFVRVTQLVRPEECPPQVNIFTRSKRPWVELDPELPTFRDFYEIKKVWPPTSLGRLRRSLERRRQAEAGLLECSEPGSETRGT